MVRRTIPLFAVISLALLPAIPAQAQPSGWFEVSLKGSITGPWIHGCGFASPVNVVVMDTDGTTQLLNESASFDGECFIVTPSFGPLPGMFVSVSDGSSTEGLTLVTLSIDVINPETGTASGTAPPNTAFHVDTDVCPGRCEDFVSAYPVSDGEGAWTADFGALGAELVPGEDLGADIFDEPFTAATIFDRLVPPNAQDLMDEVRALVGGPRGKSLIKKLRNVERQLDRERITGAIATLREYVGRVRGLIQPKGLSAEAGRHLILSARALIAGLGG